MPVFHGPRTPQYKGKGAGRGEGSVLTEGELLNQLIVCSAPEG